MTRAASIALLLGVVVLAADDLSVTVDPKTNFATFKTFALRDQKVESDRPELDNRLFVKTLGRAIRDALVAKGLTESKGPPDLFIDVALTGQDVHTTARGLIRGAGPQPVRYTSGTLLIDMTPPGSQNPVWRGVYRDDEQTGSKLVQKLPEDARKLIDRYPKLRK